MSRRATPSKPTTPAQWLAEIARAYLDAAESIPFGPLVGADIRESNLFQLAPAVCLKFRGLRASSANLKRATDAALASYVVNQEREPEAFGEPRLAFAFCYLAAHGGLDLVSERGLNITMDYVMAHEDELRRAIARARG